MTFNAPINLIQMNRTIHLHYCFRKPNSYSVQLHDTKFYTSFKASKFPCLTAAHLLNFVSGQHSFVILVCCHSSFRNMHGELFGKNWHDLLAMPITSKPRSRTELCIMEKAIWPKNKYATHKQKYQNAIYISKSSVERKINLENLPGSTICFFPARSWALVDRT